MVAVQRPTPCSGHHGLTAVQRTAGPPGFSDHFRWQRAGAQPKFRSQSVHDERDPEGWPETAGRSSRPVITNNAIQMRMVPTPTPIAKARIIQRRCRTMSSARMARRRAPSKRETRHRTALSPRLHPGRRWGRTGRSPQPWLRSAGLRQAGFGPLVDGPHSGGGATSRRAGG
jgi:hypothetical protein